MTAVARIANAIQPHGVLLGSSPCEERHRRAGRGCGGGVRGRRGDGGGREGLAWLRGGSRVITGSVSVSVTVTTLVGRVSVTAGRVSVTVAGGTAGSSIVVSVAPSGGDVVAGRLRAGIVAVRTVDRAPLPPLPQPAVASATATPSNAAMT